MSTAGECNIFPPSSGANPTLFPSLRQNLPVHSANCRWLKNTKSYITLASQSDDLPGKDIVETNIVPLRLVTTIYIVGQGQLAGER